MKLTMYPRRSYFHRPYTACLSHATKDGHLVLKGEESWRTVNGVAIFLPRRQYWFEFRYVTA